MATLVNMAEEEKTPEELALEGFDDDSGATVVDVEFKRYDDELVVQFGDLGHAVVQVGFPGTTTTCPTSTTRARGVRNCPRRVIHVIP
jgi:hypothetical protein